MKSPIAWEVYQLLDWEDPPHSGVYAVDGDDEKGNHFEATAVIVFAGLPDQEVVSIDGIDCTRGDELLVGSSWKDEATFIKETEDYYEVVE